MLRIIEMVGTCIVPTISIMNIIEMVGCGLRSVADRARSIETMFILK